ncbi:MAG: amidohydrolase [Pseudomonadota bacterium]|nr:amidohydrolase [Pseudomonadota bacterium]
MNELRVSLIQTDLQWQQAEHNRQLLEPQLLPLAGETDLIVLPEMFTSAFTMNGAIAEEHPGPTLEWMQRIARMTGAALTGSVASLEHGKRYNRLLFVKPDGSYVSYDKKHLFRMLGEDKRYAAGSGKVIVEWKGWRILPLVCYDLRFPVWSRYTQVEPYDLLVYVANWPAARNQHWRTLLQARAIENLAYVAGVNRIGRDGNNLDYVGHSALVDPQGNEVVQAGDVAGVYTATLSPAVLTEWRTTFPAWMDADTFTLHE